MKIFVTLLKIVIAVTFISSVSFAVMLPDSNEGVSNHLSPSQKDPNKQKAIIEELLKALHFPQAASQLFLPDSLFYSASDYKKADLIITASFYQFLAQVPDILKAPFLTMFFGDVVESKLVQYLGSRLSSLSPALAGQNTVGLQVVVPEVIGPDNFVIRQVSNLEDLPLIQKFFRLKAIYKTYLYIQIMEDYGPENFWLRYAATEVVSEASYAAFSSAMVNALKPYGKAFETDIDNELFPQEILFEMMFHLRDLIPNNSFSPQGVGNDYLDDRSKEGALGAYNDKESLIKRLKGMLVQENISTSSDQSFEYLRSWRTEELNKLLVGLLESDQLNQFLTETVRDSEMRGDFLTQFVAVDEANSLADKDAAEVKLAFQRAQAHKDNGVRNYVKDLVARTEVLDCGGLLEGQK